MRILFLSRWYPFPADNGSKIRIFNLIKQLASENELALISFTEDDVDVRRIESLRQFCRSVDVVPYRHFRPGTAKAALGLFSTRPRSVVDSFSAPMRDKVEQAVAQSSFDAVIASQNDMAPYGLYARGVPRLLEEVEISIYREQARREVRPMRRLRKQMMWSKWRRYFGALIRKYDGCTVVSQPEVEPVHLAAPGYEPIAVIPNGADVERFTGDFGRPQPNTIVYTGALTYYVNLDAMKFFIGEVLPRVQAEVPEVRLRLAGRMDGVPVDDLPKNPAVEFVGHLSDIRPFVTSGWLSIVPERVGGGTRIKVLESMALGTPVVATEWATIGLTTTDGRDILASDDPGRLAELVVRVLRDPDLRQSLSAAGRQTIEGRYDWRVVGRELNTFLHRITRAQ
jgi:glycosyltransferase involved in cell wall biosynthesis